MLLPDALILCNRLITTGETHQDYDRTVKLADDYKIFITGVHIGRKLIQFVQREDKALFAQRMQITKATTPAMAESVQQPFEKVTRTDRIRKSINVKSEDRKKIIENMILEFYGSKIKKTRGLDYWTKTRFKELTFSDPNAWIVTEWDSPEDLTQPIRPRPFEVSARQALNFFVVNDEVKWLWVRQSLNYKCLKPEDKKHVPGYVLPAGYQADLKKGYRYTLYDEDVTIVLEQVDREYNQLAGEVMMENEQIITIKDIDYRVRIYTPNLGYAPVLRVGYKRDEETDGRTFVNPWHKSICYFEKSLKTVSEFDLSNVLHTFPQKLQYVQRCTGPSKKERCSEGFLKDGSECPSCKGSGYKLHTTAGDAIILPFPDDPKDMVNLDGILVYKSPPIDLLKFQSDLIDKYEAKIHQTVYNSQVFVKKSTGSAAGGQPIQTATENENNYQSVYDTLEPYTEKISEVWRELVTTFARLAGELPEDIVITHEFSGDFKLKSGPVLMNDRKAAVDSGAPGFIIESIDDDLAMINFTGDPIAINKYNVRKRYFPFSGSTPDEIAALMASQYVPEEPKVLYANFSAIFQEIDMENPEFWMMTDIRKQREIVAEKVDQFQERIKEQNPVVNIDTFRNIINPGAAGSDAGQNAGSGNNNGGTDNTTIDETNQEGAAG